MFAQQQIADSTVALAKRHGSRWRRIPVLMAVTLLPLLSCAQLEPGRLPAADIRKAMAGNTIVHINDRTGFKWHFDENWKTLFDPDHGFPVRGQWHIWRAGNKLCNWDVDPDNVGCAAVYLEDGRISLDYGKGLETYSLVQGNAADPADNPGLDFDPSRELALHELLDVAIQPPGESLPAELAGFSGAWYGTWYSFRDFAIIVEKIDPQTASVIYAIGPNKWTDGGSARSRKVTGRIKGTKLSFDFWKGSIVCSLRADGKLDVVYKDEGWAGRSVATRWNNPPWASSTRVKLQTPDPTEARAELQLSALLHPGEPGDDPIHNSYFSAMGPSVGSAHDALQGRIEIGDSQVVGRPAGNRGFRDFPALPTVSLDIFTVGDELVPRQRHRLITGGADAAWDLIVEPGRVWSEAGDRGWSRAAFPFALIDQGGALRNGLATFVYNAKEMSPIRFQIVKESSPSGHLDLWGSAQASYTPDSPPGLQALIETYGSEVAERVDIRPWSELEALYGKELLDQFDGNRIRRHISRSGLIIDGKVFASDCRTRYGPYPYCRQMRHAVYSATKSLAGWLTTLRMAEKYGAQIMHYKVSDYVDMKTEYAHWDEMTFDNLLSMVSGIGEVEPRRVSHYVETSGSANDAAFYSAATGEEKLAALERIGFYPWAPGEVFRYASYEPFMLALALSELLRREQGADADLWEMMNREVFQPIGLTTLPIRQTLPDAQGRAVPIFNHGLFVTLEDIVKIEALIRAGGKLGNRQILHAELLKEPFDSGVEQNSYPTGWINNTGEESRYFRSFWYGLYPSAAGCKVRVPLMSGAGGNAVLIMPNGITALRFASGPDEDDDNDTYDQTPLGQVADAIRPLCGSDGSQ